jgi:hypothetical protein
LVARVTKSAEPSPTQAAAVLDLTLDITNAIVAPGRIAPGVAITQKPAAGNQVLVSWTVSVNPADVNARANVRADSIKILAIVKAAKLDYGSVLLAATGVTMVDGKKKSTVVLRAKYTRPLVLATDWPKVSADAIYTLCDDKPAIIAPEYR